MDVCGLCALLGTSAVRRRQWTCALTPVPLYASLAGAPAACSAVGDRAEGRSRTGAAPRSRFRRAPRRTSRGGDAPRCGDGSAGTLLGSGTVSNADRARGVSCLAERRMLEILDAGPGGKPRTPFMKRGDRVEIEMLDPAGRSVFGRIAQEVI